MSSPEPAAAEVHSQAPATSAEVPPIPPLRRYLTRRDWLALVFVAVLPLIFYWRATLGQGMFFFGDIARFFYPTRVLYANALAVGRLPLWQPEILAGMPLLAEMQTGVLYPLHLLLYRFLPIDLALNYDILFHLAWLAAGTFLFARARRVSTVGALITALALTLGGFGAARITHPNVLSVATWLPWLLLLYEWWRVGIHRALTWALLVLAFALQWFGGHPQFALINCLTFGVYVVAMTWLEPAEFAPSHRHLQGETDRARGSVSSRSAPRLVVPRERWVFLLQCLLIPFSAVLLGTLIASAQLLPTFQFSQLSARAGGVDRDFFTMFSYHPLYLALLSAPFLRGNPYPNTSVEVIAYVGILPLLFAISAVILRRDRITLFWVFLALGALVLAFGGYTPIYPALRFLPLFNFFRVPARFLFPFSFALAMLAGIGFDVLRAQTFTFKMWRNALVVVALTGLTAILILILVNVISTERWLDAWRLLPVIFGGLGLLLILRAPQLDRGFFTVSAIALTLLDLMAFSAVYAQTYNQIAPRTEIFPQPRVLDNLKLDDGARVLTSEWVLPWISVMNQSLYPSLNAAFGVSAAGGYTPLEPRNMSDYLSDMSPVMLNKLAVRYYLIPQLLPVDPSTEAADVYDPFIVSPISQTLEFSPVDSDSVEIDSSLAQSVDLPTGTVVADVVLTDQDGKEYRVPLQAGIDTAEWAYDRSDVLKVVKHARPEVATTYPARSAFPIEEHEGHAFRGRINFAPAPVPIVSLRVEPKFDGNLIHIQTVALLNGDAWIDLAPLLGKGRHTLVYRSEDVAVYENPDASPRAFITHNVKAVDDATAFQQLRSPQPNAEIYVSSGPEFDSDMGQGLNERADFVVKEPERVVLDTHLDSDGYLVLADAWDPGWIAKVDGVQVPIARADVIFRAVLLNAGSHRVEFLYRPSFFYIGVVLSAIGLGLLGIVVLVVVLKQLRRRVAGTI